MEEITQEEAECLLESEAVAQEGVGKDINSYFALLGDGRLLLLEYTLPNKHQEFSLYPAGKWTLTQIEASLRTWQLPKSRIQKFLDIARKIRQVAA